MKPEPIAPLVSVPTEVSDEAATPLAKVEPVREPAGATTAALDAAVSCPCALTAKVGIAVDEP